MPRISEGMTKSGRSRENFEITGGGFIATGATDEEVAKAIEWVRYRIAFYGSTPRSIKWQNYVLSHTDHDYLDLGRDVWVLGECFSQREFYSDYQVEPIFKSDLESLLTFAPWMSNEREESYLKAIAGGTALERDLTWTLGKTKMDLSRYGYAQSLSLLSTEKAYLLPSMQKSLTFNESPENSKQLTEPENDHISTNITNNSPIYHNQQNSWRSLDRF